MQDPPQPPLSNQIAADTATIETCGYHVWANGETVKNNRSKRESLLDMRVGPCEDTEYRDFTWV